MLRIADVFDASGFPSLLEFDEYIPVRFQTDSRPLGGARYIRVGNFHTSLLEIRVPSDSLIVRSFSLTLLDSVSKNKFLGDADFVSGLPILKIPSNQPFSGPESARRLDIYENISAYLEHDNLFIVIGSKNRFDRAIKHGRVSFLIFDDIIVGIRIENLIRSEKDRVQNCTPKLKLQLP